MRAPSMRRELLLLREMRDAAATIREFAVERSAEQVDSVPRLNTHPPTNTCAQLRTVLSNQITSSRG